MSPKEFSAPSLSGLGLLAAVQAIEHVPLLKDKFAFDGQLHSLRDRHDIEEPPTLIPIPLDYINPPKQAALGQPIPKLNPELKSSSGPFLSFWNYHEAYTQFKTTPLAVAHQLIEKLKQSKDMHWVRFQCQDILEQAELSTIRYKHNTPFSQMDGCFITIKEEVDIQGLETKIGTKFINDGQPASNDATMVTKLKQAGVIVIGSAVMNELGWDVLSVNPNTGTPKNPYQPDASCGGSSGGSGGAVAGGLVTSSIGADGGGSVRIPASFCGLYGLKTSYARVSGYRGALIDPTVGAYGPLSATADDMTLTYCITAGPDVKDPNSLVQPAIHLDKYDQVYDLSDLTIAITPEWNKSCVEPAILEQLKVVQQGLEKLGARFVEIDIPYLNLSAIAHSITISNEMASFASRYSDQHHQFLSHTRIMCGVTSATDGRDYVRAQQVRTRMMNHLQDVFEKQNIDLIFTPTTGINYKQIPKQAHAYGISDTTTTVQMMTYCTLANLTGIPAVSVPAGFHDGMPIGVQFMSKWFSEDVLCRIAKACEGLPDIERKRPENNWFAPDLSSQ